MVEGRRQVAVVLGGTSGIGAAVSRRLGRPGNTLVLGYLQNRERAESLAAELRLCAHAVHLIEGNIADAETLTRIVDIVDAEGGVCDALVHSVAVTAFKPLTRVKPNQWDLTLEVSARSFLDAVRQLEESLARARGSVVAISSHGSVRHVPGYGALGPAKAALEALVRQLAGELGPRGVRVNAVRAGLVEGPVVDQFPPGVREAIVQRTALGRLGSADDVAAVVEFLLGSSSNWVHGQVVEVDGGFAIS